MLPPTSSYTLMTTNQPSQPQLLNFAWIFVPPYLLGLFKFECDPTWIRLDASDILDFHENKWSLMTFTSSVDPKISVLCHSEDLIRGHFNIFMDFPSPKFSVIWKFSTARLYLIDIVRLTCSYHSRFAKCSGQRNPAEVFGLTTTWCITFWVML